VADALTEAGIAPSTVHFLAGAEGVAFLERLGNWFTRALSEGLTDARGSLEHGPESRLKPNSVTKQASTGKTERSASRYLGLLKMSSPSTLAP
jgi:hypothetical protein